MQLRLRRPIKFTMFQIFLSTLFLLNVLVVIQYLWGRDSSPSNSARCTSENFPEYPGYYAIDVNPSHVVCVDKRAPALLYPLPIPNLRGFVRKLINGETSDVTKINAGIHATTFPMPQSLYYSTEKPVGLLILIKTAAWNVANRNVYRSTWANAKYLSKFDMPVIHSFLIGTGQFPSGRIPERLAKESTTHGDIVFEDFVETYRNNTFKTFGGFKWALEIGPTFEFLLMIDDDIYLSIEQAVRFLRQPQLFDVSIDRKESEIPSKYGIQIPAGESFYAGYPVGGYYTYMPIRDPGLPKWYNSWDEYPFEKFPVYPAGRQIFYSRAAVQELYMASAYVKHLGVDDAYIGIIAAKLGLWLTDLSPFIIDHNGGEPEPNPSMEVRRQLISWHVPGNVSKVGSLWREIQGDVPTRAKTIYFPCCGKSPWFWILQYSGFQLGKLFDHREKESFQK